MTNETTCQGRHTNVQGVPLSLSRKCIGKSVCMEYTVKKENLSLLQRFPFRCLLSTIVLLSTCIFRQMLLGSLIFAAFSFFFLYCLLWDIEKEVLLVTASLGLQFTSFCWSGKQTTCFIPWDSVRDFYIVEAISFHQVLYNLVIHAERKSEGQESTDISKQLIPLFQGTKPRLSCLESIYQSIHSSFIEESKS